MRKKGLTLIETVIAMVIAAIMLLGFLQICNTAAFMLKNIKYRMRAINIAASEIEDLKAGGYIEGANRDYVTYVIIDEGPTSSDNDDVIGSMNTKIKEVSAPPGRGNKITVEITWNIMGQARGESLGTVIYER